MDMLRAVARSTSAEELDRCLGPARRELARLLPELDPGAEGGDAQERFPTQLLEHVEAVAHAHRLSLLPAR